MKSLVNKEKPIYQGVITARNHELFNYGQTVDVYHEVYNTENNSNELYVLVNYHGNEKQERYGIKACYVLPSYLADNYDDKPNRKNFTLEN